MTTTNTSASAGQDSHGVAVQAPLNLSPDSITALRWSNKLVIEDVVLGGRFRGWREHSAAEGERWLRYSAESGDFYAMESLGLRLFNGDGLSAAAGEGLAWLRRSAELGNPVAMVRLAECLLEGESPCGASAEAEWWLRRSAECGNGEATVVLGSRLVAGAGLVADPARGQQLLKDAAHDGSQLAHVKLGTYLLSGRGLSQDSEEGLRWLQRIGAKNANHMSLLAFYVYMKSLAAETKTGARVLAEEAAVLFQEAVRQGNDEERINLAYLLRRGEIEPIACQSIDDLLAAHVNREIPAALMNQALCLAKGVQCDANWKAADALVGRIRDGDGLLAWWFARSEDGDAEGHLVTGWLVRHELAGDPELVPLAERMSLARDGGWSVPDWMNHAADSRQKH